MNKQPTDALIGQNQIFIRMLENRRSARKMMSEKDIPQPIKIENDTSI